MKITLSEAVHVSMCLNGEAVGLELTAGDVEAPDAVAELLITQGLATVTVDGAPAKSKAKTDTTPSDPTPEA